NARVRLRELLHQPAERALAVGRTDRPERAVQTRRVALEVAVVREHPVAPPQLAHERMGVLERDRPLRRLANVGDDVRAADRIVADHRRDRRLACARRVDEEAHALVLEERDAETVLVLLRARREPREAEHHVGRHIGVHAEELAHEAALRVSRQYRRRRHAYSTARRKRRTAASLLKPTARVRALAAVAALPALRARCASAAQYGW